MDVLYTFQGQTLRLRVLKNAKKNVILRKIDSGSLKISVPKFWTNQQLVHWLGQHEEVIERVLQKNSLSTPNQHTLPEKIWFRGQLKSIQESQAEAFRYENQVFYVPKLPLNQQQQLLYTFLWAQAKAVLLTKLAQHAQKMNLSPAKIALTDAKTFWGVCRPKTGIRLNWRLIGASDFVIDYVCIHELCHLWHANHSAAFWASVAAHTDDIERAKMWLKKYGRALFALA